MTAVVTLDAIFLNDALDPSDFRTFAYVGDTFQVSDDLGGGVDDGYASGRSRLWSTEDDNTVISFTAENLTDADLAWIKAHRGRVLCFRDFLGRKVYCAFHQAQADLSTAPVGSAWAQANTTLPLTLRSVSWSEAV